MADIKLGDFLSEGKILRTKLAECNNWVTNIVYAVNDDCIEIDIGLEKDYIENIIMVGDTMRCKYTIDSLEYSLVGWVTRIKADYPQSITIRVHQVETFENKRSSYRYDVYLSSVIKLNKTDSKGIFAILVNISKNGLAFIVREDIGKLLGISDLEMKDIKVFVDIYVSPEKLFTIEGVIMRMSSREKGIEYGIQVVDMDLDSERILNNFIIELENKDKEFYNKRGGFWSKNSKFNKE
ncbi:MAG: PilZ domain-containing protein [Clostridia bacterium]|nr:PilZ domain-containing protein [Clostridia bacterium]